MKKRAWCSAGVLLALLFLMFLLSHNQSQGTKDFPQTLHTAAMVCIIRNGAGQEYDCVGRLSEDDEVVALDLVEDGNGRTWYKIDVKSLPADSIISADEYYIRSDLLIVTDAVEK